MFSESGAGLFSSYGNFLILIIVTMIAVWLWVKFVESRIGGFIRDHLFDKLAVWYENLSYSTKSIVSKVSFFMYTVAVISILLYFL